jgi:hypothetical protein
MKTLLSVLFSAALIAIAMIATTQPASARVGVYAGPFGFGVSVDSYRNYCRDPWYRHRYWRYCQRFYDDDDDWFDDNDDGDYDDDFYDDGDYGDGDFFLYDDDGDFRHHRHHRHHRDHDGGKHHDHGEHHEHHEHGEHHHHTKHLAF